MEFNGCRQQSGSLHSLKYVIFVFNRRNFPFLGELLISKTSNTTFSPVFTCCPIGGAVGKVFATVFGQNKFISVSLRWNVLLLQRQVSL